MADSLLSGQTRAFNDMACHCSLLSLGHSLQKKS